MMTDGAGLGAFVTGTIPTIVYNAENIMGFLFEQELLRAAFLAS
jgi:hypothetical protein